MRALRIVLTQSSANYKKEETIDNKMTYPLPPISTIIGALHNACGYKEYHPMDISIQGRFESMHREPYTDYCFLNSAADDRGILVKVKNDSLLSFAFEKVASTKKSKGNSFRKNITIQVHNEELINEFRALKDLKDKIDNYKKEELKEKTNDFKVKKDELAKMKKSLDKKSGEFKEVLEKEKLLKSEEKELKEKVKEYEYQNYTKPIGRFKVLITSLKYYEILNNIELVIHVKSDDKTLKEIEENIYNLKSIGRSEDFVNVEETKIVTLMEDDNCDLQSKYSAFLKYDDVKSGRFYFDKIKEGQQVSGTKYYLNKKYSIVGGKRVFEKEKVLYASQHIIDETSENVLIDSEDNKNFIVNFI